MGTDRLNSQFHRSLSHSLRRCIGRQDRRTVLVAAKYASADRTASQYWGLPEISLLTGPPDSIGDCQNALVDKLELASANIIILWSTSQINRG
jgi:hypothetical protein